MKVLLANNSTLRCGVAAYGRNLANALRGLGHEVVQHNSDLAHGLPPDYLCETFDVLLINWMAGTLGFLRPEHVPTSVPMAMYFHESFCENNRPRCPIWDKCQVVFTPEPCAEGAVVVEFPCPEYEPPPSPTGQSGVVLGNSSIRREGCGTIEEVAQRNGWVASFSGDGWVTDEAEVERLAQSTVNLYLYSNGFGGQSSGVMTAVAARRPIILSRCRQFETLFPFEDQLYFVDDLSPDSVEGAVWRVLADISEGQEKRPNQLARERCWSVQARKYEAGLLQAIEKWKAGREGRA